MFEAFSQRARQVVFAARFKAGERGAEAIGVDDLLLGLLIEDQGMLGDMLSKVYERHGTLPNTAPTRAPLFPSETATKLLTKLNDASRQSQTIGLSTEMSVSSPLERAFDTAKVYQAQFHHSQIEPVHLLAAILTEESSQGVKLLQEFGITQEVVLHKLRGAAEK